MLRPSDLGITGPHISDADRAQRMEIEAYIDTHIRNAREYPIAIPATSARWTVRNMEAVFAKYSDDWTVHVIADDVFLAALVPAPLQSSKPLRGDACARVLSLLEAVKSHQAHTDREVLRYRTTRTHVPHYLQIDKAYTDGSVFALGAAATAVAGLPTATDATDGKDRPS